MKYVFPFCFKRGDKTISCSKEIAEELISCCGLAREKSAVIYNGLELDTIKEKASIPLPDAVCGEDEMLIVSVGRQLVALIPVAWLLSKTGEVQSVWWAFPIAELVSLAISTFFYRRINRKIISTL